MTDSIADMIIRIKNAVLAGRRDVAIPHSRLGAAIADLLKEHGYIEGVTVKEQTPQSELIIALKYVGKTPAITDVRRVSKPGRRVYSTSRQVPRALGGYGITIVSTNKGILTDTQARKQNVGGEVLCQIW